jgi:hypothetical protein
MLPIIPLPTNPFKPDVEGTDFTAYIMGPVLVLIVILLIWLALKMAVGPTGTLLKSVGESLGKSLAGGYDALKKAKLPVMQVMPAMPGPRQTTPTDTPIEEVFPVLKPSSDIQMTNPMFKNEQMFKDVQSEKADKRRKTMRNRIPRSKIRSVVNLPKAPAEIADTPAPAGTPAAIAEAPAPAGTPAEIADTPAPAGTPAAIAEAPAPTGTPAALADTSNTAVTEIEELEKEIQDKKKNSLKEAKSRALASNAFKKSVKPPALPPHLRGESIATPKTLEEVRRDTADSVTPVRVSPPISAPKTESKPAAPVNRSEMAKPMVEKAPRRLPPLERRLSVASNTSQGTTSSKKSTQSQSDRPAWNQRFVSTEDFAKWTRPVQISYLKGLQKQKLDTSKFEPFMKKYKGGRRRHRMKTGRRI